MTNLIIFLALSSFLTGILFAVAISNEKYAAHWYAAALVSVLIPFFIGLEIKETLSYEKESKNIQHEIYFYEKLNTEQIGIKNLDSLKIKDSLIHYQRIYQPKNK